MVTISFRQDEVNDIVVGIHNYVKILLSGLKNSPSLTNITKNVVVNYTGILNKIALFIQSDPIMAMLKHTIDDIKLLVEEDIY